MTALSRRQFCQTKSSVCSVSSRQRECQMPWHGAATTHTPQEQRVCQKLHVKRIECRVQAE